MTTLRIQIAKKREHGDIKKIHEWSGISCTTLRKVFESRLGSRKIINAIEDYYIHIENVRNQELQKAKSEE